MPGLWFSSVAQPLHQIIDDPVAPFLREVIGARAVLPNGEANGRGGINFKVWLRQPSGQVTRQHVAAASLGQIRVAG